MAYQYFHGDASSPNVWGLLGAPANLFITSPPYNIKLPYEGYTDNLPQDRYLEVLESTGRHMWDNSTPDATLWVNLKIRHGDIKKYYETSNAFTAAGWVIQRVFCWCYSGTPPCGHSFGHFIATKGPNPHSGWETVIMYRKEKPYHLNRTAVGVGVPYVDKKNRTRFVHLNGGQKKDDIRCAGDVWFIPHNTRKLPKHPCPFPVGLADRIIKITGTPENSLVVDPFAGIGAVGIACASHKMQFVGMDVSRVYVDRAVELLTAAYIRHGYWYT